MKQHKFKIFVVLSAALMLLSGCADAGFGDDALLRPPRATGDEAKIQDIISEQAGNGYTLKYPQNGDNRSAVIMRKNDDRKYAVALYSTESDAKLNVSIISYEDEKWKCIGTFSNTGTGVDRVIFDDIDSNGVDEIIIGWSTYDVHKKNLTAYSIENETVREMDIDETYSEIIVSDITDDSVDEIILLSLSTSKIPSQAKVYQYSEQEKRPISIMSALNLDPDVTEFANVIFGKIDKYKKGLVIDSKKSGDILTTQIIYYNPKQNMLVNPLVEITEDGKTSNVTARKDAISSRDIDDDGIIEVPVVTQMAASTDQDASTVCSLTSWKQLSISDDSLQTKMSEIINYNDGYSFMIPDKWKNGAVTAVSDAENRQLTFYIWNSSTASLGDKLLILYRYTKFEWSDLDKRALIQLENVQDKSSNAVFAAQIFNTKSQDSLNITEQEVKKCTRSLG